MLPSTNFALGISESHDLKHFVLFLENHDGESYNLLMHDLSQIYLNTENEYKYFPAAVARSTYFVRHWWRLFAGDYASDVAFFHKFKTEIIACAAAEFACSALREFRIGNVFTPSS